MSDSAKELNTGNFDDFTSKGNVIIDFWAAWCGPCKILSPELEAASKEMKDVKVGKVDIDGQQELAEKFGVMSIPTLLFMKDGKVVDQTVGAMQKADLISLAKSMSVFVL